MSEGTHMGVTLSPEEMANERAAGAVRRSVLPRYEDPPDDDWQPPSEIPDDGPMEPVTIPPPRRAAALIQSSAEFISGFLPPDYLLDGILQRRFIYSLTGRTGSGKSALLLKIAAAVDLGRMLGNHQAQGGRVLYLAGENPDDIRMRWIAMSQRDDFEIDSSGVHFVAGTFPISEMFARIEAEARVAGPFSLVIVDTSAAFFEGDDENSNTQQGAHARRLRGLAGLSGGPCVIVASHPTKNASPDNLQPRGGGAFIAEMDGNLTANKTDGVVELHWQCKFRGPDFPPITFRLDTVTHERLKDSKGRLIPTVTASYLSDVAQEEMADVARTNENAVLGAMAKEPSGSLADIARTLGWSLRNGTPDKVKVKRARDKLVEAKLITIERGKPIVTDKGRKVIATASGQPGSEE